ncbi:hypothetical protein IH992_28480 [Candidatus Poribacteria bacterium]|nr:hypothetical protein [Candidatus Poribacteria bacterium]
MPRCKSCDAEIKFIRTEKGRKKPVDIKPAHHVIRQDHQSMDTTLGELF